MKKLLKILTMVAAVLTTAVLFTTCKQFLDDPEDFLSYWAAEVVPTGYDIDIAKPYLISNDGVICVPSNNYLLSDGSVTVTIYLRNPKKFSLVMPSSTSSALDVQKIIRFPGFDADHQPKYSADNDYTLKQTPDKQALKLKYKSSFLKKHEWGTADIGPEITLKSTDGRQFNKKFSLNLKVNTAPSFDYKGVGKTYAGGKWYYVLIFQAKNMEQSATAGHYVHEDIEKLHIVKQDESAAHYTVSNIDFPNKKINWTDSYKFLSGATQLAAEDCEGTPPPLPTGDWLIYFKTDVEVSTSSALKTYEAWLSDKAGLLSNKVQGSTCIRKIGDIEVLSTPPHSSGTGSFSDRYKINCDGDGVQLEVWCQTPDEDVNILYWIWKENPTTQLIKSGEETASPTNPLKTIRLSAPADIGDTIRYKVKFNAKKTPGFGDNERFVYYELKRKVGSVIDGNEPNAWAKLKYAIEYENESEITIKNTIKAQNSSITIGGQIIKNYEQINVGREVKIKGFDTNAVINADSKCRIFNVANNKKLTLEKLKLTGGRALGSDDAANSGGGIYAGSGTTITMTGCTFDGNVASYDTNTGSSGLGGAVYAVQAANVIIKNCIFDKNMILTNGVHGVHDGETGKGGAVCMVSTANVTIEGCTFTGNKAKDGSGVCAFKPSNVTITKCIFKNNINALKGTAGYGGAVCALDGANVIITDCTLTGNKAKYGGAVAAIKNDGSTNPSYITIKGGIIGGTGDEDANIAKGSSYGGGIYVGEGCNLTLKQKSDGRPVQIIGNMADHGGGLYAEKATVMMTGCIFKGNKEELPNNPSYVSQMEGGAICAYGSTVTINDCTFRGNKAVFGGAIYASKLKPSQALSTNNPASYITIKGGIIGGTMPNDANKADNLKDRGLGGGIYVGGDCSLTLQDFTAIKTVKILGNTARMLGNGIYVGRNGKLNMQGSTQVNENNDVYLGLSSKIYLFGALTTSGTAALITPDVYDSSVQVLDGNMGYGSPPNYKKFEVTPKGGTPWYVGSDGFLTTVQP